MSESEFHVHGAHEHEMEHASHGSGSSSLAVATAILATVGAVFSYMGGYTQANAALFKNDAAIKKTEAANQWNFYQAKSSKQNMSELSAELMTQPDKKQKYLDAGKSREHFADGKIGGNYFHRSHRRFTKSFRDGVNSSAGVKKVGFSLLNQRKCGLRYTCLASGKLTLPLSK